MKSTDDTLRRLFESAAMAPTPASPATGVWLENQVMASWRADSDGEGSIIALFQFFKRAALVASLVFLLSAVVSLVISSGDKTQSETDAISQTMQLSQWQ